MSDYLLFSLTIKHTLKFAITLGLNHSLMVEAGKSITPMSPSPAPLIPAYASKVLFWVALGVIVAKLISAIARPGKQRTRDNFSISQQEHSEKVIGTAIVRGGQLYVLDTTGRQLFTISSGPMELVGYTTSTVSVRIGPSIITFDSRGQKISEVS
jgi:hypothetical protein